MEIVIRDGTPIPALAKGTLKLSLPSGRTLTIEALLVPRLHTSLLSVSELAKTEPVQFLGDSCLLSGQAVGKQHNGVFDLLRVVIHQRNAPHLPTPMLTPVIYGLTASQLTTKDFEL